MRLDRRFLNWGLFFIVLGGVPLAVQQGWLDEEVARRAWQLWPLLIVAAGIGLLLRRTSLEPLGGLLAAVTAGAMLGGVLAVGADIAGIGRVCGGQGQAFAPQQGTFVGRTALVRLELNCGDMNVTTAGGSGWSLSGSSDEARPPDVTASGDSLGIQSRDRSGFFPFGGGERDEWSVVLPTDPTLDLASSMNAGSAQFGLAAAKLDRARFQVNAGSLRVDLTEASVARLDVNVNAGSAKLVLPNSSLTGSLEANAGSIQFCTPPGAGVRISTNDNPTGANNFGDRGLVRSGSSWETPGFSSAASADRPAHDGQRGVADAEPGGRMPMNARLFRSRDDRMVAGVAGGLAAFLNIDPSLVRILWVVLIPLTGGLILLLYLAMALIVPQQRFDDERWRAWEAQSGGQSAGPWPPPESNDPAWPGDSRVRSDPPPSGVGEPASDSPLDAKQLTASGQDDATRAFEPATEPPSSADVTLPPGSGPATAVPGPAWPTPPPNRGTTWPPAAEPPARPDGTAGLRADPRVHRRRASRAHIPPGHRLGADLADPVRRDRDRAAHRLRSAVLPVLTQARPAVPRRPGPESATSARLPRTAGGTAPRGQSGHHVRLRQCHRRPSHQCRRRRAARCQRDRGRDRHPRPRHGTQRRST